MYLSIVFALFFIFKKQFINTLVILLSLVVLYLLPGQKYLLSSTVIYVNDTINEIYEKLNITFLSPINNTIANWFIIDGTDASDDSLNSRDYYMEVAKRVMLEYPYSGVGVGNYNYLYKHQNVNDYLENDLDLKIEYLYPHNLYYHYGAECGIISLILLIGLFITIMIKSIKNHNIIISILFLFIFLLFNTTESLLYMKDIAFFSIIVYSLMMKKSYESKS